MQSRKRKAATYSSGREKRKVQYANPRVQYTRRGIGYTNRIAGNPALMGETKYFDTERVQSSLVSPAYTISGWSGNAVDPSVNVEGVSQPRTIFSPKLGNSFYQREGRKCWVKGIRIKGTVTCPYQNVAFTADNAAVIRLILYQDKQTNYTQITPDGVISGLGTCDPINYYQNSTQMGRFRVLVDKTFTIQNPTIAVNSTTLGNIIQTGLVKTFKYNIKFKKPVLVTFANTNNGNITDIQDNSFHFVAAAGITDLRPYISYASRCIFFENK